MEQLIEIAIRDFGAVGLVASLGAYGYLKINNKIKEQDKELHKIELETSKIELIELDLKEDIRDIKNSISEIRKHLLNGKK